MVLSNASMDGLSALSELHTQRLLSESQVDLLKPHLLRNGAVAQDFWANTKRLHEFRASGILSEEECAEQIQKHVTEVLTPASARERPAAAVESATPSASRGPSTQPKKAAKSSTQRQRARERAAANVLGGNIVNAFAIANRVSCHKKCSSPPAGWQLITVQYCPDNVYCSEDLQLTVIQYCTVLYSNNVAEKSGGTAAVYSSTLVRMKDRKKYSRVVLAHRKAPCTDGIVSLV